MNKHLLLITAVSFLFIQFLVWYSDAFNIFERSVENVSLLIFIILLVAMTIVATRYYWSNDEKY